MPTHDEITASAERLLRRVSVVKSQGAVRGRETLQASIRALREAHGSIRDPDDGGGGRKEEEKEELFDIQDMTDSEDEDPGREPTRDEILASGERLLRRVSGSRSHGSIKSAENLEASIQALREAHGSMRDEDEEDGDRPRRSTVELESNGTGVVGGTYDHRSRVQEETLAALREMNANIVRLTARDKDDEDDDRELDRSTIRLDGLEVYAVVSALTTASSIACFDAFAPHDWEDLWDSGEYLLLAGDTAFLLSNVTGIVAGMHATLVFSLMTMYGRTALGTNREDAVGTFFDRTGGQRYRGFQTFLFSMYAFLLQLVILVTAKAPGRIQALAFLGVSFLCHEVYLDTKDIVTAAGIIFAPPAREGNGAGRPSWTAGQLRRSLAIMSSRTVCRLSEDVAPGGSKND